MTEILIDLRILVWYNCCLGVFCLFCGVFFSLITMSVVTSITFYMMHFYHLHFQRIHSNYMKTQICLMSQFLSPSNFCLFLAFLSIPLFSFSPLEPASTQLGPEGHCGDTRRSSQRGELFLICCYFSNFIQREKQTHALLQTVCKIYTWLFQLLMFILLNISCFCDS